MNDIILKFLRKNPNQHFNARQIAKHLKLIPADHKDLRQWLKDLVTEGKIILHPEERYSCMDESKIVKGTLKIHADGYGFLLPESAKKTDVFVPKRSVNFALNGDTVLVESRRNKRDGRYEGRVIQILERANSIMVGQVVKHGRHHYVSSIQGGREIEVYVPQKHLKKAAEGDVVAVKMIQFEGPGVTAVGEVSHVIGDKADDESLTNATLYKYQINREFSKAVKKELKNLPDEVEDGLDDDRRDLSHLPIITIDGITAKDFDDAVCVVKKGKTFILYVSIADVSEYVSSGSAIDQEAYKRGTSVYLPDECVPMLPEKLSNGICSLNPNVPRLTLTAEIHYNAKAEFTGAYFYRSLIRSHKRATYEEVQSFIDGTTEEYFEDNIKNSLMLMNDLAEKLIRKAEKRGTLGFDLPEAEFVYDVHGKIQNVQRAQRFFAHKLIEMFMVAANVAVAQLFDMLRLPILYRIHEEPDPAKVQNFIQLASNMGLQNKLHGFHPGEFFKEIHGHQMEQFLQMAFLRSLKQAVYDAENVGHYGLHLEDYCHFTSPIRRYPDLIVHRQLRRLLDQTKEGILGLKRTDLKKNLKKSRLRPEYSFQDLKIMGTHCSKKERDAVEAEREVLSMRQAFFMRDFIHEKFFGRITRITKNGMVIELDPYFVSSFLSLSNLADDYYSFDEKKMRLTGRRTRKSYRIGDRIWVTVTQVKIETADVVLALAEKKGKKSKAKGKGKDKGKRKGKRGKKGRRS